MADPALDTATQRPPTGVDPGVRDLILQAIQQEVGLGAQGVVNRFFRDVYGGYEDYFGALEDVWDEDTSAEVSAAAYRARQAAQQELNFGNFDADPNREAAYALLKAMPESDFRAAVTEAVRSVDVPEEAAARIDRICRRRGTLWEFSYQEGFEYIGDEEVERELIRPALAAISRPEFAGAVASDFESARHELGVGSPKALEQAVHQAGCAVESAMKVALEKHDVQRAGGDGANRLFDRLVDAGIVERDMQDLVLAPMKPRNRRAGHGAGAEPHDIDSDEAAAVVASAAGAIAFLATRLP